jgi:Protein phosphatase 2C
MYLFKLILSMYIQVLDAMSLALKKADERFLSMADTNPELALMGSCVLVMLMKGEDLYLMNVGDSRAVLAQKAEPDLSGVLVKANDDLEGFKTEMMRQLEAHERDNLSGLVAVQMTIDHSTGVYQVAIYLGWQYTLVVKMHGHHSVLVLESLME